MKRSILWFAAAGGLVVPIVFTALGAVLRRLAPDNAAALGLLHDVQLPLWPMSRLILDDPSGRHWLYLPLAAILSNALIYAAVGAFAGGRRGASAAFAMLAAVAILLAGMLGFGTGFAGFAIGATLALGALVLWRHRSRGRLPAPEQRPPSQDGD